MNGRHHYALRRWRGWKRQGWDTCCRDKRGGVAVELALVLPVLLTLAFATLEFANVLVTYKRLVSQTRLAARYLSTQAPGQGYTQAQCLLLTGTASATLPCAGTAVLPGLADATIQIADAVNAPATQRGRMTAGTTGAISVNLVTVRVSNYRHQLLLGGWMGGFVRSSATITFGTISATMRQVL
ncbi:MAG: hypothetical protein RIQ99_788 [Pseudomonadota bacterium]